MRSLPDWLHRQEEARYITVRPRRRKKKSIPMSLVSNVLGLWNTIVQRKRHKTRREGGLSNSVHPGSEKEAQEQVLPERLERYHQVHGAVYTHTSSGSRVYESPRPHLERCLFPLPLLETRVFPLLHLRYYLRSSSFRERPL